MGNKTARCKSMTRKIIYYVNENDCVQKDLLVMRGRLNIFIEQTKGRLNWLEKHSLAHHLHRHENGTVVMKNDYLNAVYLYHSSGRKV